MKKILAVVSVLMAVLMLAACGGGSSSAPSSSEVDSSVAQSSSAASSSVDSGSLAGGDSSVAANTNLPDRGKWDGDVYTNPFAGFSFTLPSGWTAMDDEQFAAMIGFGLEALGEDGNFSTEALEENTLYEMMAVNMNDGSNLMVMYENISVNPIMGIAITPELYLELVSTQAQEMYAQLDYTFSEVTKTELGGTTYYTMVAQEATQNVEQHYYAAKKDGYVIAVILSVMSGADADEIVAGFGPATVG